jgi:hypothetical protein
MIRTSEYISNGRRHCEDCCVKNPRESVLSVSSAFYFLLLSSFLFSSCTSSPSVDYGLGKYYVEIVTALGENTFRLDSGKTLYAVSGKTDKSYEAGDRVVLSFSYMEKTIDQVTVHASSKISLGALKSVEEKEIVGFADDPVRLESLWIGSHYLNFRIYMEYKSEKHTIALFTDKNKLEQPEMDVYFRHDAKNDPSGYPVFVYLSFDLKETLGEPEGSKILQIHLNTTNYGRKTYELNY